MKTILSKNNILALIQKKPPLIESFVNLEEQLQPNGFDLTLKEVAMIQSGGQIAVSNKNRQISSLCPLVFNGIDNVDLVAGAYAITFNEIVNLPRNVMALGYPRSSLLRCGVTVQNAVWDAGYHGRSQALLVVYNPYGFRVQRNARLDQLVFFELSEDTEGYNGAYQGENIK
jgi:dUTP pyrophosphatase